MAPIRSFTMLYSSLVSLSLLSLVHAAPWIITEDYQAEPVTLTEEGGSGLVTYTQTQIESITPTVTSMPAALSTTTAVIMDPNVISDSVTIVEQLYPTGVGASPTPSYGYAAGAGGYGQGQGLAVTQYFVNIVYTAASSCSSHWTTTSAVRVYVPYFISGVVPVTATSTTLSVDNGQPFRPYTYTTVMAFVNPTQLPTSYFSEVSTEYSPYGSMGYGGNVDACAAPIASATPGSPNYGSSSNSGYSDNGYSDNGNYYDSWLYDPYPWGISPLAIILISILGSFALWFVIGLLESWFQFRRLMKGWEARRGPPRAWSMLAPFVSCAIFCFTCKGYHARSEEDAAELEERWSAMSFGKKLGLWLRWGFRYKYPPMLGRAPPRVGGPRPVSASRGSEGAAQAAPLLHVSPPRSAVSEREPEGTAQDVESSGALRPEMTQVAPPQEQQAQHLQVPSPSRRAPSPPGETHS